MTETLYAKLLAAGVPLDHHESDLYAKATPEARAIIAAHRVENDGHPLTVKAFTSEIDRTLWLDIAFHWQPFWDAVARRVEAAR